MPDPDLWLPPPEPNPPPFEPLPATVDLPRMGPAGSAGPVTIPYPLPVLPFPPYRLTGIVEPLTTEEEAETYRGWLTESERARVPVALRFFAAAGAPVDGLPGDDRGLPPLQRWLEAWFPPVWERWRGTHWGHGLGGDPCGGGGPGYRGYSLLAATVEWGLAHDVAFIVVAAARRERPRLKWTMLWLDQSPPRGGRARSRRGRFEPNAGRLGLNPIELAHVVIWRSLLTVEHRARMDRGYPLESLASLYRDLLTGPTKRLTKQAARAPEVDELGPAPDPSWFASGYHPLREPALDASPPSPHLVAVVAAFRAAGWFAWADERSDPELAAALMATWAAVGGEPLAVGDGELDWQLVVLDGRRTLWVDIEVGTVQEEIGYSALVRTLADLTGGALRVSRVSEDWDRVPDSVVLTATTSAGRRTLRLPEAGDMIHPGVVLAVNRWLRPTGVQFYFLDTGGQMAIVTRATEAERRALEAARPLRLDAKPPPWWRVGDEAEGR